MINSEEFIKRLEKILQYYGLTASAFADEISVQRSSISHLLGGRNKPSLEFVLKVVKTFPEVNLYWLLNGKGSFPAKNPAISVKSNPPAKETGIHLAKTKVIQKIIIFYEDGSFKVFDKNLDIP